MSYIYTKNHTPIFSSPNFLEEGLNQEGLLGSLEMIALPGSRLEVRCGEIAFDGYPVDHRLYTHERFLAEGEPKAVVLPRLEEIQGRLLACLGLPYVWGGNVPEGIDGMLELFPEASGYESEMFAMRGVDCSGLLYHATNGYTPRNTSMLMEFGKAVNGPLKPLDLILYPGHVIIVLDETRCIESKKRWGVFTSVTRERDWSGALIRRWFSQTL